MENCNKMIPPHLNAEVYRTNTAGADIISYLDYLCLDPDGGTLVGCSELTGRQWNGGACIYQSVSEAQKCHPGTKKSIQLTTGSASGCFVGSSSKVLLCEDNGGISIWSRTKDIAWQKWAQETTVSEHDDAVLAVDCLQSEQEYVTAGADGIVKVWDINEMICIRNYLSAHSLAIYGVVVRPNHNSTFATGSLDHYVSLWDNNVAYPVLDLAKNDCSVRCLKWINENELVFGDEAGILYLVDTRKPESTTKLYEFPAAVHQLAVNPNSPKVAVCCDNKIVSVCDLSDTTTTTKVIYHDANMHNNYVRSAAWDVKENKTLHTLGWDGEIKSHIVYWD